MSESFFSDEQCLVRDSAREFAQNELAPHAAQWDQDAWVPDSVVAKLGELGFSA